jgi:hypothetical protein
MYHAVERSEDELESVFLSYRREDSAGYAGLLAEHLSSEIGHEHVFIDVHDIVPGQDFAQAIENTISACQAVIVVIGPRWVADLKQRGGQDDFVLHEVSVALRRNVTVIPVLVGGTPMPSAADLPESIAALSRRQALEIRDGRFEDDTKLLVEALRRVPGFSKPPVSVRRRVLARILAGAVILAAAAFGIMRWKQGSGIDVNGIWIAEMQKPNREPFQVRLDLAASDGRLAGSVAYPTGDATIQAGTIENGALKFFTTHLPQFASEEATIRWSCAIEISQLRCTEADDNGIGRGIARRSPP